MNNKPINIIWEDKGIILGIILFILKNFNDMSKNKIIIDNDKIRSIIKELFSDLKIKKYGKGFYINIKNNNRTDLVINNLNNLSEINSTKVRLLPRYDKDNPIIMFEYNKNKKYNMKKLQDKIAIFDKTKRWLIYDKINFIEQKLQLQNWDTFIEYQILKKYVKRYNKYNIGQIYIYICYKLKGYGCDETKIINIPVPQPIKIIDNKCDHFVDLLNTLTNKIKVTNEILNDQK